MRLYTLVILLYKISPIDSDDYHDRIYKILNPRAVKSAEDVSRASRMPYNRATVPLLKLTKDILNPNEYDPQVRPKIDGDETLKIHISMSLYQIIHIVRMRGV